MVSRTSAGNVVFLSYALVAARRIAFSSVGSNEDQTLAKGHVLRYDTVLFALKKWFGSWMNWTMGGKLRYWYVRWVVRGLTPPWRSKCMVSAALASWRVLGSCFCNVWLKTWLLLALSAL